MILENENIEKKERCEELNKLLNADREGDGEEIFACMMDDLIYFASLLDVQGSMLRLLMLNEKKMPKEMWEYSQKIKEQIDQTMEKWELYATTCV
ncbi:hypothetical protein [Clostridium sp. C105KSO13]|uniref:hypothetical protein n=1 Tax=Clostridium sp. C105KSO13 TaxID=1776045 RepID=UPI00074072B9|nr:hypothetical protein [Clostridium sp. C105KSO13]CUX33113.1 hypothetical protein BN3456_01462 [Clostridium sp. C105KSO13]